MARWALYLVMMGVGSFLLCAGCSSHNAVVDINESGKTEDGDAKKDKESADKDEKPGAPFRLPGDSTGKMLANVLPPVAPPALLRNPSPPAPPPGPRMPNRLLEPSLPATVASLILLPAQPSKSINRPDFILEEALEESFDSPLVPKVPAFTTGSLSKFDSDDVSIPPMLPPIATRISKRVSVDDATMEASTEAVLTAPLPVRTTPLAFERLTRPEPFEHRLPLTLTLPEEGTEPHGGTPIGPQPGKK